jgi:hypothetical protein
VMTDPSANAAIEPNTEILPSMFVSFFIRLSPPFGRVRCDERQITPRRGWDKYDFDMRVSAAEMAAIALNLHNFWFFGMVAVDRDGQQEVGGCSTAISIIL